ncbi:MAG: selenoprotein O, partial [Polyangiaceae bacterium]
YEQFFFDWYGGAASAPRALAGLAAERYAGTAFEAVRRRLDDYGPCAPERLAHPYWQRLRPCTLLIDEIETIWKAIAEHDDWSLFEAKIAAIRAMGAALAEAGVHDGSAGT